MFNFLRNYIIFSSEWPSLHMPTSNVQGFNFSTFLSIFVSFCSLIVSMLMDVRWCLIVVLIFIFLMINIEYFFMCLLVILDIFWERCPFVQFLIGLFFCCWVVSALYIIWKEYSPISHRGFRLFYSLDSFQCTKVLNLWESNSIYCFLCFWCPIQQELLNYCHKIFHVLLRFYNFSSTFRSFRFIWVNFYAW